MQAGFYEAPGQFRLTEVPDPVPEGPEDVLVEVEVAGLCGTDLHIVSVPQMHPARENIVLGHEFVGRVVEKGPSCKGLEIGQRVIAGPNIWCGQCQMCRRGLRKMCEFNQTLGISRNGGFASHVVAPARVLYPVPAGLSAEEAVFAEPLSCVLNGLYKVGPTFGDRVAILGAGPIGLYFTRLYRYFGATQILVSEPLPARRAEAIRSGATWASAPEGDDIVQQVRDLTEGGADVVVDTTGFLLPSALKMTRKAGTVLVFGMDSTCVCEIRPYEIVREEKTVVGCFIDNDRIPRCLEIIPHLQLSELISHRLPLDRIGEGIEALRTGEAIKALVVMGQGQPA